MRERLLAQPGSKCDADGCTKWSGNGSARTGSSAAALHSSGLVALIRFPRLLAGLRAGAFADYLVRCLDKVLTDSR